MRKKSSSSVKRLPDFSAVFIIAVGIGMWFLWPAADKYAAKAPAAPLRLPGVFYITDYESKAYLKPDMFAAGGAAGPVFRDEDELLVPMVLESVEQSFVLPPPELPAVSGLPAPAPLETLFSVPELPSRSFMSPRRLFERPGNGRVALQIEPGRNLRGYGYEVKEQALPEKLAGRTWQVRASVEFDAAGNVEAVFIDAPHSEAAVNRYVEELLWRSWLRERPRGRVSGRVIVAAAARLGGNAEKQGADNADQDM